MGALSFGSVVLGGNVFGWTVQEEDAFAILDAFVAGGGRAIDTADMYPSWAPGRHGGESEAILGAWLTRKGRRNDVVIATKVAKWREQPGLSRANIRAAIEGSLRRLKVDHVDLYYAHEDDERVPQEEYVRALDELVREGKVRALGASNFRPERLASAIAFARENGLAAFEVSQDHWNLVARGLERTLVPVLEREGVKELPYFALASGFLTGKYRPGVHVASERAAGVAKYLAKPANVALLGVLDEIAAAHRVSVAAVALAWLRAQPVVAAPIASARTVEHLDPMFEAARLLLTPDEVARLSAVSPPRA
jgi:aryl-alcohol dehydrogenase-like predicted oxidoreductase